VVMGNRPVDDTEQEALLRALLRERFPGMVVGTPASPNAPCVICGHPWRAHGYHGCPQCLCVRRRTREG
jgi:hypothetical protein